MREPRSGTAIVTGATGQDGYFLVNRLLADGWTVYAPVRDPQAAEQLFDGHANLFTVNEIYETPVHYVALIGDVRPEEFYNLAGESSVSASFVDPRATWETNAHVVVHLLDAVRKDSPGTRFYQASSGEMFGSKPEGDVVHNEDSALSPQSPYAAAKAAAHLLCRSYRESFDLRVACGLLFNHESHRRDRRFLTRRVVDHLHTLRSAAPERFPIFVGNLRAQRDWGYAPDYVEGMQMILRQTAIRGVPDVASEYRDYVLGTGRLLFVWELIDRAFVLAGFELKWELDGPEARAWRATFADTGELAVGVDKSFVRPADPRAIAANPARIRTELGWRPRTEPDVFLRDMLDAPVLI